MTKTTKKFALILLAVMCLVVCFGALVACNPTDDGVEFTVTVLMPDDSAAVGVDVTVKKGNAKIGTKATGSDGKAVLSLAEDDYTVTLSKLPKHYEVAEGTDLTLPNDGRTLTIKLVESFSYKVYLIDLDGEPFYAQGVSVIMCTVTENGGTGNCLNPEPLEVGGVARIGAELGNYHVKVEGLPEEYEVIPTDLDAEGYHNKTLTATDTTVTIYIQHVLETTTDVVAVTETLTQFDDQAGTLIGVPMDGTAELVYNETDKFYHFGKADGPVVVVNITESNDFDRFGDGALAYFEMVDTRSASYVYNVSPEGSPYYVQNLKDYRTFIRGFADYEFGDEPDMFGNYALIIPTEIETETYYAKFVNSDGVYPLTKELETFLKDFYKYNKNFVDFNTFDAEEGWLFPCYYYGDASDSDPIEGTYKFVSITENGVTYNIGDEYNGDVLYSATVGGVVTADAVMVQFGKTGFNVYLFDGYGQDYILDDIYNSGTWTKDTDGTYTFTVGWGATMTYNNGTLTYVEGDTTIVLQKA